MKRFFLSLTSVAVFAAAIQAFGQGPPSQGFPKDNGKILTPYLVTCNDPDDGFSDYFNSLGQRVNRNTGGEIGAGGFSPEELADIGTAIRAYINETDGEEPYELEFCP